MSISIQTVEFHFSSFDRYTITVDNSDLPIVLNNVVQIINHNAKRE